jgi:predicted enzyme related to lactoylglutathione lyase
MKEEEPMRTTLVLAVILALTALAFQEAEKPPVKPDVGAGRIAWFDLTTSDMARSKDFYGKLLPWTFAGIEGTDLAVEIVCDGTAIGTLRVAEGEISAYDGVVYVQVDDMRASCARARELGGTVPPGFPFDLPDGGGAVGLVIDPVGHPVGLYAHTPLAADDTEDR